MYDERCDTPWKDGVYSFPVLFGHENVALLPLHYFVFLIMLYL